MLYGVASIRDAAGADRLTFRVARVGVRGAGALLPASSAARGGADVGAPCHPSRDRVILLSILTYTFCVRLVCRTPAHPRVPGVLVARVGSRAARRARTRGPPGPRRSAGSRIADWVRAGGGSSRGARTRSGAIRFSPGSRAVYGTVTGASRPGYARGQVTKARTTISSYRNIDASAAGSGEPRVRRAYHDDDLVAREVGSRDRVRTGLRPLPRTSERARRGEAG